MEAKFIEGYTIDRCIDITWETVMKFAGLVKDIVDSFDSNGLPIELAESISAQINNLDTKERLNICWNILVGFKDEPNISYYQDYFLYMSIGNLKILIIAAYEP